MATTTARMPVVFFAHGSPTIIREDNAITQKWRAIAESMPTPRAILCISAHWETNGTAVTAMAQPRTIHDFGRGLGADLFEYQYPAPGSPELAQQVADLLAPETPVKLDHGWGFDHGSWSVMLKAFPDADIPVVQLSLDRTLTAQEHLAVGRQLRPLRDDNVLIAASGNVVHNLPAMQWSDSAKPYDWATGFNEYIKDCVKRRDDKGITDLRSQGDAARLSIPSDEHYLPLLYAAGAADDQDNVEFGPDFVQYKSLSMTSMTWRPRAAA